MSELFRNWHPLDGIPAPEYIPDHWIGPHVGKRLIEGLRTLGHMPINGHPSGFVASWPAYAVEWADELAQAQADAEQKAKEQRVRNWTRIVPTSREIAHMEMAIAWPASYLRDLPQLLRVVGAVAAGRARYRELPWIARRLQLPQRLARRWNREGLDIIATGLHRDGVPVF